MSRYSGRQYEGAARTLRAVKREEAERRNTATPEHRRRRNGRGNWPAKPDARP